MCRRGTGRWRQALCRPPACPTDPCADSRPRKALAGEVQGLPPPCSRETRTHWAPPWPLGQWEVGRGGREHCPRLGKRGEGGGGTDEAGGDLACDVCVQGMGGASGAGEGLPWAERGRAQCQLYRWFGLSLSRAKVRRGPGAADTPQKGSPESQVPLLASWAGPLNPWTPSCPSRSVGSQQGPPRGPECVPGAPGAATAPSSQPECEPRS